MTFQYLHTSGHSVYGTVIADEGEVLTKEKIEEKYFVPFGGHITGMSDDIAHIVYYND